MNSAKGIVRGSFIYALWEFESIYLPNVTFTTFCFLRVHMNQLCTLCLNNFFKKGLNILTVWASVQSTLGVSLNWQWSRASLEVLNGFHIWKSMHTMLIHPLNCWLNMSGYKAKPLLHNSPQTPGVIKWICLGEKTCLCLFSQSKNSLCHQV